MIVTSKQRNVNFIYLSSPFTIDKSNDWGGNNLQSFPNGGWIKLNPDGTASHGVQGDNEAPVGWYKEDNGTFSKFPIHVGKRYEKGDVVTLTTLDGEMTYNVNETSYIVSNDSNDSWLITKSDLIKHYNYNG